jgi:DnaJ-class molecular chaperone
VCGGSGQLSAPDCNQCHGVGSVDPTTPDTLAVPILPGARDGATIVLHGAGHAGMRQGPRGDVIATLAVRPHRVFERDGQDLRVVVPVALSTALAGGVVRAPALGANGGTTGIDVAIPPMDVTEPADGSDTDTAKAGSDASDARGSNSSIRFLEAARVVPVEGWGMSNAARKRGRLLVQVVAVVPSRTALTRAQRDAMAALDPQFHNTDPNGECVEVVAPTTEMLQEARAAFSFLLPKPLD